MIRIFAAIATLLLAGFSASTSGFAQTDAPKPRDTTQGVSIYICGHSFHQFIDKPLAKLALEAGFTQHRNVGKYFVGGSSPTQIWNIPDGKNPTRAALRNGDIDIFTLSPNAKIPDPGMASYAEYAIRYNPSIRVMVQLSWPPNLTAPDSNWALVPLLYQAYWVAVESQVQTINRAHGKSFVSLVPVALAVFKLRDMVIAGKVPGIAKPGDLFIDKTGHAASSLENLTTFCWFAAVYKKSPEGMTALDSPATKTSAETNRVLQKIAWEIVGTPSSAPTPAPTAAAAAK